MAHMPIAADEKLDAVKDELALAAAVMGFEANSLKIMAHRPEILRGFMALSASILGPDGILPPGLRQMIAYMASATAGCNYCQAHTAHGAFERGVDAEKIENIWSYESSELFGDAERAALSLAQAGASVPNRATQAHFDALTPHFNEAEICEIVGTISLFGFLNRWNDTMATALEDSPLAFAEAHLTHSEWKPERHK